MEFKILFGVFIVIVILFVSGTDSKGGHGKSSHGGSKSEKRDSKTTSRPPPSNIGWQIPPNPSSNPHVGSHPSSLPNNGQNYPTNNYPQQAKPVQQPTFVGTSQPVNVNQAPQPAHNVIINQAPQPAHTVIVNQAPQPVHTVIVHQAPQPSLSLPIPIFIPSFHSHNEHTNDKKEVHTTSVNSTIITNNYYNGTAPAVNSTATNVTTPVNSSFNIQPSNNNSTNSTTTHIVTKTVTITETKKTFTKSSSYKVESLIFYPLLLLIFILIC